MNELQLIKSERFGEIEADIYSNGEDMFMTINQLAACLGYADRSGVQKLVDRNDYLNKPEFSCWDNLSHESGAKKTRIFTEDGIYEVTMLSGQPKAKEFRAWIRGILKALRSGRAKLVALPKDYAAALRALADETEKAQALQLELDRSQEWYSIKRVANMNGVSFKTFDWRKLKRVSAAMGHEVKKIFDANYGEVNTYHMDVWERVYPNMEL